VIPKKWLPKLLLQNQQSEIPIAIQITSQEVMTGWSFAW